MSLVQQPLVSLFPYSSPTTVLVSLSASNILDALFLGLVLALFKHYQDHKRSAEPFITQITVFTVVILSIIQTGCNIADFVDLLPRAVASPADWISQPGTSAALISITCLPLVMLCSHMFMTYRTVSFMRLIRLRKRMSAWTALVAIFCSSITVLCLAAAVGMLVYLGKDNSTNSMRPQYIPHFGSFYLANLVTSSSLDLLVACLLSAELYTAKTAFASTKTVLASLASITLTNGVIVTALQASQLLCYLFPSTIPSPVLIIGRGILGKTYAITLILLVSRPARLAENAQSEKTFTSTSISGFLSSSHQESSSKWSTKFIRRGGREKDSTFSAGAGDEEKGVGFRSLFAPNSPTAPLKAALSPFSRTGGASPLLYNDAEGDIGSTGRLGLEQRRESVGLDLTYITSPVARGELSSRF